MTGQKMSMDHFYGDMIWQYVQDLSNFGATDRYAIQDALGLTEHELKLGLDWCLKRGLVSPDNDYPTPIQ